MQCKEARNQLSDYLTGAMDDAIRPQVEEHVRSCSDCAKEFHDLNALWSGLGLIPAGAPDSARIRAKFGVMLESYKHGLERAAPSSFWHGTNTWIARWWPEQPVLQLTLSVTLMVAGILLLQNRTSIPASNPEISQLRQELQDTRQMVALSLLQQQSASGRLEGVNWTNRLDDPNGELLAALFDTLLHDPNVNVRLASIDALKKFGDRQTVRRGILDALGRQESPLVQIGLIDLVVEIRAKESIATLEKLTSDGSVHDEVRKHAKWGIERLMQG